MKTVLELGEKLLALLGILICLIAGLMRLGGSYHIAGIETLTLFTVGMGTMLTAILLKLHLQD